MKPPWRAEGLDAPQEPSAVHLARWPDPPSAILDAVEDVIGPDILCWGSSFFIKEPRDPGFVSWHQDSTYWGLDPADIVTAWVALSDSTAANGAMRVIPDTQRLEQIAHRDTFAAENLLTRGQEIVVEVDESKAVMLALQPGEMSLHHVRLIHGSDPNPSATAGSALRSAICRRMCGRSSASATARRWFAASTGSAISSPNMRRTTISPMPRSPSTRA